MIKRLISEKTIKDESAQFFILKYYLTEKPSLEYEHKMLYGVSVEKNDLDHTLLCNESISISYKADEVIDLINTLANYEVTPVSTLYVVNDLMYS